MFRENNYESMKGARYASALVEANGNFVTSWLKYSFPEVEKLLRKEVNEKIDHSLRTNTFRFLLKKAQDKVPRRLVANMTTVSTRCKLVS